MVQTHKVGVQITKVIGMDLGREVRRQSVERNSNNQLKQPTNSFVATHVTLPLVPSRCPSTPWVDVRSARPTSLRACRTRLYNQYLVFQRIQFGKRLDDGDNRNVDLGRKVRRVGNVPSGHADELGRRVSLVDRDEIGRAHRRVFIW